eukprot:11852774-Heterocapsa_arctica.AAC.1
MSPGELLVSDSGFTHTVIDCESYGGLLPFWPTQSYGHVEPSRNVERHARVAVLRSRPELSPDQHAQDQAMRTARKGHPTSNVPVRLSRTL